MSWKMYITFCLSMASLALALANKEKTSPKERVMYDKPESEKKSRFISFNNDHGEVKIELDFAIPFMTIPVKPKSLSSPTGAASPLLEINTRGLVAVGTILFFLITLVPKLVKIFVPQAQATVADGIMPLMARIDDALHAMNIPRTDCYLRSACWLGKNTLINPSYLSHFGIPEWLQEAIDRPEIQEAFHRGQNGEDCSAFKCSIPSQTLNKLIETGKAMMGKENNI